MGRACAGWALLFCRSVARALRAARAGVACWAQGWARGCVLCSLHGWVWVRSRLCARVRLRVRGCVGGYARGGGAMSHPRVHARARTHARGLASLRARACARKHTHTHARAVTHARTLARVCSWSVGARVSVCVVGRVCARACTRGYRRAGCVFLGGCVCACVCAATHTYPPHARGIHALRARSRARACAARAHALTHTRLRAPRTRAHTGAHCTALRHRAAALLLAPAFTLHAFASALPSPARRGPRCPLPLLFLVSHTPTSHNTCTLPPAGIPCPSPLLSRPLWRPPSLFVQLPALGP